ncbi:MAG: S8 family serine peptidase [Gemmobacter sp.]
MAGMPTDMARRRLLIGMGLGAAAAYSAPLLTPLGMARASGVSGISGVSRPSWPSRPSRPSRPARQAQPAPPPEIVVFLPAGVGPGPATGAGYSILSQVENLALDGALLRLGLPPGRSPAQALAELAALLPGALADDNHLYRPDEFLCDAEGCAAHDLLGWTGLAGGVAAAPRIGMIDTGINVDHAALAGQKLVVTQADLGRRAAAGRQHGTAIAALLIGRADSRVPGLLPEAELVAVEAFHRDATGEAADAFALAHALDLLLAAGVGVINLSFSGPANVVLERLVTEAAAQGVALVAAAGNNGPGAAPAYPAAWPQVVAVTAVDSRLAPYRQANRGPHIGFAAPGVGLWTAASISGGRLRSGTSYAAPFVTAALAVERLNDPDAPPEAAIARLAACAGDLGEAGFDEVFGHGLVADPSSCDSTPARYFPAAGD